MATFKLTIETDNAAFGEMPEMEIARILRRTAGQLDGQGRDFWRGQKLFDSNGNDVGQAALEEED